MSIGSAASSWLVSIDMVCFFGVSSKRERGEKTRVVTVNAAQRMRKRNGDQASKQASGSIFGKRGNPKKGKFGVVVWNACNVVRHFSRVPRRTHTKSEE